MKNNGITIAILSGKGGTGKTMLSVNLASVANKSIYIDCDVEEPNGYLFFKPEIIHEEKIMVYKPIVDDTLCNGCRTCVDFCKFNAFAFIKNKPYLFEEVCHSCGGCILFCPQKAIKEKEKIIGVIQNGMSDNVNVYTGIMNTGETSGVPIIKKLLNKKVLETDIPVFIDCPPGSSCIVMESIKDADYCILVAEPTVFGVHNLNMVYELVTIFNKPCGVILNKCLEGENPAEKFCFMNNIPILGSIPFDIDLGRINSDGKIATRESKKFSDLFISLYDSLMKEVGYETIVNP